jgi:ATP-dependent Clp protease ATP-binding subunit ClpA
VHVSNDLTRLLNLTDKLAQKRKDQYISSELFVLAALEDKGSLGELLRKAGASKAGDRAGHRQAARRRSGWTTPMPRTAPGAGEVHHRPHRARRAGQARPGDRP